MHSIAVITRKGPKYFTGPAGWDEITPDQYLHWVRWQTDMAGDPAVRFFLLVHWFGVPRYLIDHMTPEHQSDLLACLDWSQQVPDRWMLPELHMRANRWIGPGDRLGWLTFGEYMFADAAARAKDYPRLAAALYRPVRRLYMPAGEWSRSDFNDKRLDDQARHFARLSPEILHGIYINYLGATEHFAQLFPRLCRPAKSESDTGAGWLDVGLSLARQTQALGSFRDIEKTSLFVVMTTLEAILEEQEKLSEAHA